MPVMPITRLSQEENAKRKTRTFVLAWYTTLLFGVWTAGLSLFYIWWFDHARTDYQHTAVHRLHPKITETAQSSQAEIITTLSETVTNLQDIAASFEQILREIIPEIALATHIVSTHKPNHDLQESECTRICEFSNQTLSTTNRLGYPMVTSMLWTRIPFGLSLLSFLCCYGVYALSSWCWSWHQSSHDQAQCSNKPMFQTNNCGTDALLSQCSESNRHYYGNLSTPNCEGDYSRLPSSIRAAEINESEREPQKSLPTHTDAQIDNEEKKSMVANDYISVLPKERSGFESSQMDFRTPGSRKPVNQQVRNDKLADPTSPKRFLQVSPSSVGSNSSGAAVRRLITRPAASKSSLFHQRPQQASDYQRNELHTYDTRSMPRATIKARQSDEHDVSHVTSSSSTRPQRPRYISHIPISKTTVLPRDRQA